MAENDIALRINLASDEEAQKIAAEVKKDGGQATISQDDEHGMLPLAVLLVLAIPPGAALLMMVINRIVHSWRDHGMIIDARGTGAPTIVKDDDLPFGTVIVLTRDEEKSTRTDLAEIDISKYVSAAVTAVSGGKSAADAKKAGDKAVAAA